MFRTRDYVLMLSTVLFLLVGIGGTLLLSPTPASTIPTGQVVEFASTTEAEYEAVVAAVPSLDRAARAAALREKIIATEAVWLAPETDRVEPEPLVTNDELSTTTVTTEPIITAARYCETMLPYSGVWPAKTVEQKLQEGARVYTAASPTVGTATTSMTILLRLPLAPVADGERCLTSDAVGVAEDGSLIRVKEASLYSVFGEETLIGYALDGFPIYGVSDHPLDACGGVSVNGNYAYYLSADRDNVLNCFRGIPHSLP